MTALTRVIFGENPVRSDRINQIIDAWNGNTGGVNQGNSPLALSAINDPINYAVAIRNADTTGKGLIVYAPDGVTPLLRVDKTNGVYASPDGVAGAAPILTTSGTQTLTNKTLTSPSIVAAALSGTFSGTPTFSGLVTLSAGLTVSAGSTDVASPLLVGGGNRATVGLVRMANNSMLDWRNNANTLNIGLGFNTSDYLTIGDSNVLPSATTAAAGTNGAPPAQVALYMPVTFSGSNYKIPLYNP